MGLNSVTVYEATMVMGKNLIRWLVLLATLANIAFNFLYTKIPGLYPINQVTELYDSLFTPAGYAFSIWGLIYLSLLIYAVVQLLPSARNVKVYDRIAYPLILLNVLASLWIYFFVSDLILLSMVIIAFMLLLTIIMHKFAADSSDKGEVSLWIQVPFSLLYGWLTVASLANLSIWLYSQGVVFAARSPAFIYVLIVSAAMIGFYVSIQQRNCLIPLVIAWGLFGIWMARKANYGEVAVLALVCAILMVVSAGVTALIKSNIITFSSSSAPSAPSR